MAAAAAARQQQCGDVWGARHPRAGYHKVAKAAADCQAGDAGLGQVDPMRPSRPPRLIQQGLRHPAARLLNARALQGTAHSGGLGGVGLAGMGRVWRAVRVRVRAVQTAMSDSKAGWG